MYHLFMIRRNLKFWAVSVVIILAGLYLVKVLDISYPLTIVTTTKSSELSVVGEGKIDVIPDTAYIDTGITVNNVATVEETQKQMDKINNKIVDGLKKLGIAKSDIKTANYSIFPNYSVEDRTNKITGYNGNVTISIKLRNTQIVSQVIEEITRTGANQINGVRFTVDNPQKIRETARDLAIKNAKDQAQRLAKSLGIRLGRITNVVESNQNQPIPMFETAARAGLGGAGPQIEPGSQTITSVVTLFFEKK